MPISRRHTKKSHCKKCSNAFIGCCEINFFSYQKCVQKWPIKIDSACIQNQAYQHLVLLCSSMLLNVYLNKSKNEKKSFKKVKEIIEEDNQEKQNVHRLIISSSELRERESILQLNLICENKKTSYNICEKKTSYNLFVKEISYIHGDRR